VAATIQARVFQCASEIAGGELQLSERLGVHQRELSRWIADREIPPLPAFLGAVDIILNSEAGFRAIFTSRIASFH
jgi:hypothetical protein